MSEFQQLAFQQHLKSMRWRHGEHIFIAGPTGSGKTTLAKSLLAKREYVIGFGVKPNDPTLTNEFNDFHFINSIRNYESWMKKVIIWPRPRKKDTAAQWHQRQREEFALAMDYMLKTQRWTVFLDELAYMTNPQMGGVGKQTEMLHYVGRSSGVSVLSLAQRPAHVPLAVISSASHAYIAKTKLGNDLKRLSDLGGVDQKEISKVITGLETRHDFAYIPALVDGKPGIVNTRK